MKNRRVDLVCRKQRQKDKKTLPRNLFIQKYAHEDQYLTPTSWLFQLDCPLSYSGSASFDLATEEFSCAAHPFQQAFYPG